MPITEAEKQAPINPYGFTKLVIEHALADYAHAYGLGYAALRYFNASGAAEDGSIGEDHDPETHLIPLVLQVALGQRDEVLVFGDDYPTPDGTCIRDYIHVDDLGRAHIAALERLEPGVGAEAQPRHRRRRERDGSDRRLPPRDGAQDSAPASSTAARAIRRRWWPTPSLARKTLDWTPKFVGIEPIVASAWQWHKAHPNGYDD